MTEEDKPLGEEFFDASDELFRDTVQRVNAALKAGGKGVTPMNIWANLIEDALAMAFLAGDQLIRDHLGPDADPEEIMALASKMHAELFHKLYDRARVKASEWRVRPESKPN